jgi:hypothetical protein
MALMAPWMRPADETGAACPGAALVAHPLVVGQHFHQRKAGTAPSWPGNHRLPHCSIEWLASLQGHVLCWACSALSSISQVAFSEQAGIACIP